ncbi:hypothetical protein NNO04_01570 [Citrobacter sp. Awk 4]|uniref:hypothetical protein n=1 Tax=Citrobacter sp. Awk 4 TaxID=2963955 RepID=UPI00230390F1|nr:hypothetical protein [Citrobacter sp. Awk 4]MDA8477401.1 hypothetical protein [Citrobacter sp. Awk 4]
MLKKIVLISLFSITYLPVAQASWKTVVENDIFSSGKKAELIGEISNENQSVVFDCSEGKLAISQVEADRNTVVTGKGSYQTLIKIDENQPVALNTTLIRRSPESIALTSTEKDKIMTLLRQVQAQNSRQDFLIGVMDSKGNQLSSGSGSVSFAKKSVNKFIKACKIEL